MVAGLVFFFFLNQVGPAEPQCVTADGYLKEKKRTGVHMKTYNRIKSPRIAPAESQLSTQMPPPAKKRRTESGSEGDAMSEEEISESSSDEGMQDGEAEVEAGDQDKHREQAVKDDLKTRKGSKNAASAQEKARAIGEMYEYKSNVFRMEIDELLSEIRLDYRKRMAPVEKALYKLKSVIDDIPEKLDLQVGAVWFLFCWLND